MTLINATRILIVSHDVVGPKIAGPGIRYWELARVLAQSFPVILATPNVVQMPDVGVRILRFMIIMTSCTASVFYRGKGKNTAL